MPCYGDDYHESTEMYVMVVILVLHFDFHCCAEGLGFHLNHFSSVGGFFVLSFQNDIHFVTFIFVHLYEDHLSLSLYVYE